MADKKYKLTYFNLRGRAEVARYLFALAGADYEDHRVSQQQWSELKPQTPFGQLPVLEVGGKAYCQSEAIFRFVAREFGRYGKDNVESLAIDQILGTLGDVLQETVKVARVLQGEEKEKALEKLKAESLPKLVKFLEKQIGDKHWLVGDSITLADAAVYEFLTSAIVQGVAGSGWREHSEPLNELVSRFAAEPAIAKYVASRPETPF